MTRVIRPSKGWKPLLEVAVRELGPVADAMAWAERVGAWLDLALTWNARIDLTAARSPEELVDLAVADALLLSRDACPPAAWVDVGSGFGAPGLALALCQPSLSLTLVEPRDKRVAFLRAAVGVTGAEQTTVRRARVEDLEPKAWSHAVSRATFAPASWLEWGASLAPSVWVLLADGTPPVVAGCELDKELDYYWPLTRVRRRAVRYRVS
jgi:16S rRNA (guanine527-N7)-methyltransferase